MTAAHWFLASLPVAALSVMLGGHWLGGGVLLLLSVGRVLTLRSLPTLLVTGGLLLGFAVWFGWRQTQLAQRRLAVTALQPVTLQLRVQPDSPVIHGSGYTLVGQRSDGERLTVHGTLHSANELTQLQQLRRPTWWTVTGQASGLLPAPNFNQFDAARYWGNRGIVNTVKVTSATWRPAASRGLTWWADTWHGWRSSLIRYCEQLPGALRVYALGLFPGSRASEAPQELAGMQRLGLIHLFAISGLHVALVLTVAEWGLIQARLPREWWEWGLLAGLPGYAILAGGGSGVLRACWMRGLQLGGRRLKRPISPLGAWTGAFLVGLAQNPGLVFELGSQLSYGLSLALILLKEETPRWRELGLTLLGLPSLLSGVFQWHSLTILANWVVVPLFPVLLLPLTVLGTLTGPRWPAITNGCAAGLAGIDDLLRRVAALPGNVAFGKPYWGIAVAWYLGTWWIWSRPPQQRRRWLVGLLVSYGLVFVGIHYPLHGEVAYFDVGQGDSILIRTPGNRRVTLIDVGGRLAFPQPAWAPVRPVTYGADHTSVTYLKSRGITHINDIYLTHHDADHIGDLPALLAAFRVDCVWVSTGMAREAAWQRTVARYPDLRVRPLQVGVPASLVVHHPFAVMPADNAGSLALQGDFGGLNFLFMGDLDQAGEQKILAAQPHLRTDVLKLGHHGSKTATAANFVAQVRPRLAIISAGRHNRYGHPSPETLRTLQAANLPWVSTQQRGMIRYVYRDQHGTWQTKLNLKGES